MYSRLHVFSRRYRLKRFIANSFYAQRIRESSYTQSRRVPVALELTLCPGGIQSEPAVQLVIGRGREKEGRKSTGALYVCWASQVIMESLRARYLLFPFPSRAQTWPEREDEFNLRYKLWICRNKVGVVAAEDSFFFSAPGDGKARAQRSKFQLDFADARRRPSFWINRREFSLSRRLVRGSTQTK